MAELTVAQLIAERLKAQGVRRSRHAKSADYLGGLAAVPPRQAVGPWNAAELERYADLDELA
jgi:hypothetical protein